jgi:hypothetical protein
MEMVVKRDGVMQDNGDELVIQAVGDLLAAMVKVAGKDYSLIWQKEHCKPVLNCLKSSKPSAVRAAAMGTPPPRPGSFHMHKPIVRYFYYCCAVPVMLQM